MQDDPRDTNRVMVYQYNFFFLLISMVHRYNMTQFKGRRPPYPYAGPEGLETFQEHYCFQPLQKAHM